MEIISPVIFYIIAGIIVISAIMVVLLRNILYCAMSLILCLLSIAIVYIFLGADFLAATQIMLYVGGIMVLILFAVMLTEKITDKKIQQTNKKWLGTGILCVLIFVVIFLSIKNANFIYKFLSLNTQSFLPTTSSIGKLLLTEYVLPFEIVSLVLISSLVGAIIFSKNEPVEKIQRAHSDSVSSTEKGVS